MAQEEMDKGKPKKDEIDRYFKIVWTIGKKHDIPLDELMDDLKLPIPMQKSLRGMFAARQRQEKQSAKQRELAKKS